MEYYISKSLKNISFEQVESQVTDLLKEHGFGVITEINLTSTFKNKLDKDFRPYKILGACNPTYAHKAISKEDKLGVMLPCNVCIQQLEDKSIEVFTINPIVAMSSIDAPEVEEFAHEIYDHLNDVINAL